MTEDRDFISKESIAGFLLILFAAFALVCSNTNLATLYHHILDIIFSVKFNDVGLAKPILLWINDGLMAVFFLLVGLELKREIHTGELKEFDKIILPVSGAIGGMLFPALCYVWVTRNHPDIFGGWAIPMATDIAFALGLLAMFGKRVPLSLKVFLMTLAIIDDLGAIIIIAIFHTSDLSWLSLFLALACLLILFLMNCLRVSKLSPYLLVGLIMWLCILKSGFHATLAGVLLAFTIPVEAKNGQKILENLEHDLHAIVAFFILPVFAFANAGVPLGNMSFSDLSHPLIIAIVLGLTLGKIAGIFLMTYITKICFKIKSSFTLPQLVGVACLCGIGFTMSLFIAGLSFGETEQLLNYSRLGILLGTIISAVLGMTVLNASLPKAEE